MPTQMTDQEILQKAIEKAVKNGYRSEHFAIMGSITPEEIAQNLVKGRYKITDNIIFSHDFAKSFWGEEKHRIEITSKSPARYFSGNVVVHSDGTWETGLKEWQYHLQQMVLESNPIKYLEKYL